MRAPVAWIALVLIALSAPPAAAATVPDAPTGLVATQGTTPGTILLNWTPPANDGGSPVAGYQLYRSLAPAGLAPLATIGNVTTYTDSGIADGAPRYYRVAAINAEGQSALAGPASASALAVPSVPRAFSAAAGPVRGAISFAWTKPLYNGSLDILGYDLYRGNDSSGPFDLLALGINTTSYRETGLADNETHWYRLSAVNALGESPFTAPILAHAPREPTNVTNITAGFFPGFGVTVSWDPPNDEGGVPIQIYRVYRAIDTAPERLYATTSTTQHNDLDCPLLRTCHYRVRPLNEVGYGPYSDSVQSIGDSLF